MTRCFSFAEKSSQPAISAIVRAQPRHNPVAGSMMQTPMQGEIGSEAKTCLWERRGWRAASRHGSSASFGLARREDKVSSAPGTTLFDAPADPEPR